MFWFSVQFLCIDHNIHFSLQNSTLLQEMVFRNYLYIVITQSQDVSKHPINYTFPNLASKNKIKLCHGTASELDV